MVADATARFPAYAAAGLVATVGGAGLGEQCAFALLLGMPACHGVEALCGLVVRGPALRARGGTLDVQ